MVEERQILVGWDSTNLFPWDDTNSIEITIGMDRIDLEEDCGEGFCWSHEVSYFLW